MDPPNDRIARLERDLEAKRILAERLKLLSELSRQFAATSTDAGALLDLVARRLGEMVGEVCSIRLVAPDGEHVEGGGALYDPDPERAAYFKNYFLGRPQKIGEGIVGKVAATCAPIVLASVDPAVIAATLAPSLREGWIRLGPRSLVAVPLIAGGKAIGVITLYRTWDGEPYRADDLALVEDIGRHASLAIVTANLVAQKRAELEEQSLALQMLRRTFLEASPDAVVVVNVDGLIQLVNGETERLFGYPREELVGQAIEMLVPEAYRHRHGAHRASYAAAPTKRSMGAGQRLTARRRDGTEFAAEIALSPFAAADGVLIAATIRDVTERLREADEKNKRLEEASQMKSRFLASMSHELRTPLNSILGFTALMHTGRAGPMADTHKEYLGDILQSARHLLQLIDDVLDLAKIEAGKMEVRPQRVELAPLVKAAVSTLGALVAERRIALETTIDATLGAVVVDVRLFRQILYNFLSNALKFTPEGGSVDVSVTPEGADAFRLAVKDTGIGIRRDDLGRLFTEFEQLGRVKSTHLRGTGLGLALTRRIVEAQGGRVEVESVEGRGSTFAAILPRHVTG